MKKCIFIAVVLIGLTFFGTRYYYSKTEVKSTEKGNTTLSTFDPQKNILAPIVLNKFMDCEAFRGFPVGSTIDDQLIWLRTTFLDDMNPDVCDCAKEYHKAELTVFNEMKARYWTSVSRPPVEYELSIKDIKKDYFGKSINYEFFISFKFNEANKRVDHKLEGYFVENNTNYSIPLLQSIYNKNPDEVLVFTMGRNINGRDSVIFHLKSNPDYGLFDYSQIPTIYGDVGVRTVY